MAVTTPGASRGRGRKRQTRSSPLLSPGCSDRAGKRARRSPAATAAPQRTRSASRSSHSLHLSTSPSSPSPSAHSSIAASPTSRQGPSRMARRVAPHVGFGSGFWSAPSSPRCRRCPPHHARPTTATSISALTPLIAQRPPPSSAPPSSPTAPTAPPSYRRLVLIGVRLSMAT